METGRQLPVVLCISGHDPSGGAGIQADIEAIAALGCHACTIITALTEQDSCDVHQLTLQPVKQVVRHARRILADGPIAAIKIGLLGGEEVARGIAELLEEAEGIPVVLDPVLAAGGGKPLADQRLLTSLRTQLLPRAALITPNSHEARQLADGAEDLAACARALITLGCSRVLITGTHEDGKQVCNRLYGPVGLIDESRWPRFPASYHGSGCTLASGIAARLAHGEDMLTAVRVAQEFTWRSLSNAVKTGRCQPIPDRLFALERPGRA